MWLLDEEKTVAVSHALTCQKSFCSSIAAAKSLKVSARIEPKLRSSVESRIVKLN